MGFYVGIPNGKKFGSLEEAAEVIRKDYRVWFPLANADSGGVQPFDHGNGDGFVQTRFCTDEGWRVSEIEFKNFRPVRRIESEDAKVEMFCH